MNAYREVLPKYGNGSVSPQTVERRIEHSDILARMVSLDLVEAGWRPTAEGYFANVTKSQIVADVTDAKGDELAGRIDHLKKPDMAREAEKLLDDAAWLPLVLRTPGFEPVAEADIEYAIAAE